MARIRSIKPEFWSDQKIVAELTREQRLFYIALWNEADDQGRFLANPRRLLGIVFPFDEDVSERFIEASLRTLAETERVVLYEVDGTPYGQLTKFLEHQRINRPTESRIPGPDNELAKPHAFLSEDSVSPHAPEVGSRSRGSRSTSSNEDVSKSAPPLSDLWEVFLEELGGTRPPYPKLTTERRKKLSALHDEQLIATSDPLSTFRAILRAVKASPHHMANRQYQMPESLFRNPERRDVWMQRASANGARESGGLKRPRLRSGA